MRVVRCARRIPAPADEHGFTMIIAIMVMFVASLLMVAAFTAAKGDVRQAHLDLNQKQAYFAAFAGVQEFEYKLENNPNYWQQCPEPKGTVPGEAAESFVVTVLAASSDPEAAKTCNSANPFATIIESKGALANTFRVKAVGSSGTEKRTLIATFKVAGFLDYIYFTQYEIQDPAARNESANEAECEKYRAERSESVCKQIVFGPEDSQNGPVKTDDTAMVCGGSEFGRAAHEPFDAVEFNGGAQSAGCGSGSPKYNTATGEPFTKGAELVPPESDTSLKAYVERKPQNNELLGRTTLLLEGKTNEIKVNYLEKGEEKTKKVPWPKNGLIYVAATGGGCEYSEFDQKNTDTPATRTKEANCGSVYVSGTYSSSLTIAAETDVIVNGSITPYGVTPGNAGSGTITLGLIASRFIRIYHPCQSGSNEAGSLESPWIYAAMLSTAHSFLVDNYDCGRSLGNLNIYGAIAQKFRGIVGLVGTSGYNKEYIYDERLATDEPPYFLAPLKAGWKIARETAELKG